MRKKFSVVTIRLLVLVGAIDPGDDRLGDVSVVERGFEGAVVVGLGHDHTAPEELLVPVVAMLLREEIEPIGELEDDLPVSTTDVLALCDAVAKGIDSEP